MCRHRRSSLVRKNPATLVVGRFSYPIEVLFSHVDKKWIKRFDRFDEWVRPKVRLATINSAKGLEADVFILDTGISSVIQDNLRVNDETETRVWYVGLAGAKGEVIEVVGQKNSYIPYLGSFES